MKSLAQELDLFVKTTFPRSPLPEHQLKALRMAFYAGCFVTWERMLTGTKTLSDEAALEDLAKLESEIKFNMETLCHVPARQ